MSKRKFIELTLGNYSILNNFDELNKEHKVFTVEAPKKMLLPTDTIVFIDEEYVVTAYLNEQLVYWEYHDGYDYIKNKLLSKTLQPY